MLYCVHEAGSPRAAQIIKNNLAAIGIDVHIHCVPGDEMWTLLGRPNEPWDLAVDTYGANTDDPGEFINGLARDDALQTTTPGSARGSAPPRASPALAAPRPTPGSTWQLTRDIVPWINVDNPIQQDFFSARIGCQLYQPMVGVDLGALCIRTGR